MAGGDYRPLAREIFRELIEIKTNIPRLRLVLPLLPDLGIDDLRLLHLASPFLRVEYVRGPMRPSWLPVDANLDGALVAFEQTAREAAALAAASPADDTFVEYLATAHDDLAGIHEVRGALEASIRESEASIGHARALVARDPKNTLRQRDLAIGLGNHGGRVQEAGQPAVEPAREAVKILERLTRMDPANEGWKIDLANRRTALGQALLEAGGAAEARDLVGQALAVHAPLLAGEPGNAQHRRRTTFARVVLAQAELALGDAHGARRRLEDAVVTISPLTTRDDRFALELHATALLLLDRPDDARPLLLRLQSTSRPSRRLRELAAWKGLDDPHAP